MAQRATIHLYDQQPDRIAQDAAQEVWNDVNNIGFKNGETIRVSPDVPTLPNAQVIPRTCVYVRFGATDYWVYANETGIWAHDGTTEFDITPAADWTAVYDPEAFYTSCVLGGIVYFNASDRAPVYWAGDTLDPAVQLPDWPAGETCYALRSHKNFLFAIGIVQQNGQRVRWSDAAEPGAVPQFWDPAASNLAGFVDLAPLSARAYDGATLRDSFLVYKTEGIFAFDFIGGNDVFANRKLFSEHGIRVPNAVTPGIDDVHLFLADDGDVYLTDGVQVRSVLDGKAQRTLYRDLSADGSSTVTAVTLSREKTAAIYYPSNIQADVDYATRALLYNFVDGSIGFRDADQITCGAQGKILTDNSALGLTWDSDPDPWDDDQTRWNEVPVSATIDDVLIGRVDGFRALGTGASDAAGEEIFAFASKSGLSFGNAQVRKMVSRIWPKIEGRDGDVVNIRMGGQEITGGGITLGPSVEFTIGQDRHIDTFTTGRFLYFEVSSHGGAVWRLGSFDLEFSEQGLF